MTDPPPKNEPIEAEPVQPVDYQNPSHRPRGGHNGWVILGIVIGFLTLPVLVVAAVRSGVPNLVIFGLLALFALAVAAVIALPLMARSRGRRSVGGSILGGLAGGVLLWVLVATGLTILIVGLCYA